MSKRFSRWLIVGVMLAVAISLTACGKKADQTSTTSPTDQSATQQPTTPAQTATQTPAATELKIEDLTVGKGVAAKVGDLVTVNYTGWLTDGTEFDSSVGKQPFQFTIGEGRVIQGWEQGVPGMKVGGKRKLTVPSDLGYGPQGYPPVIPGNATLIFEVDLLKIN